MLKRHPYGPCWKELALGGAEKMALVTRRMLAYPGGWPLERQDWKSVASFLDGTARGKRRG